MIGQSLLGTQLLGTGPGLSVGFFTGLLSYNDYSFETDDIRVGEINNIEDLGDFSFETYKTARTNGEGYVNWNINRKKVTVKGVLKSDSTSGLQTLIQGMKQKLLQPNKTLSYKKTDGVMVTTTATCTGLKINRKHWNITFVPFEVTFDILDPFMYSLENSSVSFTSKTQSFTDNVNNVLGSYEALPTISVNFGTGLSTVTTITVVLNGSTINITGTFIDSDIVTFDCKNKDVAINSVGEQDYTGAFGSLPIGTSTLEVYIDGIWSADIYVLREPTYV